MLATPSSKSSSYIFDVGDGVALVVAARPVPSSSLPHFPKR